MKYRPPFNTQHNPDAAATRAYYMALVAGDALLKSKKQATTRDYVPLARVKLTKTHVIYRTEFSDFEVARCLLHNGNARALLSDGSPIGWVSSVTPKGQFAVVRVKLADRFPAPMKANVRYCRNGNDPPGMLRVRAVVMGKIA